MSDNQTGDLAAGHPAAVKAGGKRIVQHHTHVPELKSSERAKEEEEFQTDLPVEPKLVVGGVVAHGDKDFSPAAARVAHEKPLPTQDNKPANKAQNRSIQQPRK